MTTHHVRRKGARHVSWVASTTSMNEQYEISKLPDGTLACACIAYAMSKARPKTCKHLRADMADMATWERKAVRTGVRTESTVKSGDETFVVLRGIDLSGL